MKLRLVIPALIPLLGMAFLPEHIPHTNVNGRVDSMDPNGPLVLLFTLLALVFTVAPLLVSRLFDASDQSPNMKLIGRFLRHYSLAFSIWFVLHFCLMICRYHSGSFPVVAGWLVSSVLFAPLLPFAFHWVIRSEKGP